jgi:hypothetical protein
MCLLHLLLPCRRLALVAYTCLLLHPGRQLVPHNSMELGCHHI